MARLPVIHYPRFFYNGDILSGPRWQLRRAIRVMNQVLSSLSLEQHPDKTFIGRTQRGFDFLGVQFTHSGETSPSAVNLARHTEKTAQLYEQGASTPQQPWRLEKRIEQLSTELAALPPGNPGESPSSDQSNPAHRHPTERHAHVPSVFLSSILWPSTIDGERTKT